MNSNISYRHKDLVDRLFRLTLDKSLEWESDFDQEIRCSLGRFYATIEESQNGEGVPFVIIKIVDTVGNTIDVITDEELKIYDPPSEDFNTYWLFMTELLKLAQRQASGAEKVLDEIFEFLDDKDIPF